MCVQCVCTVCTSNVCVYNWYCNIIKEISCTYEPHTNANNEKERESINIHYTVYIIRYTVYIIRYTVQDIRYTAQDIKSSTMHYIAQNIGKHYTVYILYAIRYTVHRTMYIYTMYTIHCILFSTAKDNTLYSV